MDRSDEYEKPPLDHANRTQDGVSSSPPPDSVALTAALSEVRRLLAKTATLEGENFALASRATNAEEAFRSTVEKFGSTKAEAQRAAERNIDLERQLFEATRETRSLRAQLQAAHNETQELSVLASDVDGFRGEIKDLRKALQLAEAERASANERATTAAHSAAAAQERIGVLQARVRTLEVETESLRVSQAESAAREGDARRKAAEAEAKNATLSTSAGKDLQALRDACNEYQRRLRDAEDETTRARSSARDAQYACDVAMKDAKNYATQLLNALEIKEALSKDVTSLRSRASQLEGEVAHLTSMVTRMRAEEGQRGEETQAIHEGELVKLRIHHERTVEELEARLRSREATIERLRGDLSECEKEKRRVEDGLGRVTEEGARMKERIDTLESMVKERDDELTSTRTRLSTLVSEHADLTSSLATTKRELVEANGRETGMTSEILSLRSRVSELEHDLTEAVSSKESSEKEVVSLTGRLRQAETEVVELKKRCAALDQDLEKLIDDYDTLGDERDARVDEVRGLKATLAEQLGMIDSLTTALEKERREREEAQGEVQAYESQLQAAHRARAQAETSLHSLRHEFEDLQQGYGELNTALEAVRARRKQVEADLEKTREEYTRLDAALDEAREAAGEAATRLASSEVALSNTKAEAEAEVTTLRAKIEALETHLHDAVKARETAWRAAEAATKEVSVSSKRYEALMDLLRREVPSLTEGLEDVRGSPSTLYTPARATPSRPQPRGISPPPSSLGTPSSTPARSSPPTYTPHTSTPFDTVGSQLQRIAEALNTLKTAATGARKDTPPPPSASSPPPVTPAREPRTGSGSLFSPSHLTASISIKPETLTTHQDHARARITSDLDLLRERVMRLLGEGAPATAPLLKLIDGFGERFIDEIASLTATIVTLQDQSRSYEDALARCEREVQAEKGVVDGLRGQLETEKKRADKAIARLESLREQFMKMAKEADEKVSEEMGKRSAAEAAADSLKAIAQSSKDRVVYLESKVVDLSTALEMATSTLKMAEARSSRRSSLVSASTGIMSGGGGGRGGDATMVSGSTSVTSRPPPPPALSIPSMTTLRHPEPVAHHTTTRSTVTHTTDTPTPTPISTATASPPPVPSIIARLTASSPRSIAH